MFWPRWGNGLFDPRGGDSGTSIPRADRAVGPSFDPEIRDVWNNEGASQGRDKVPLTLVLRRGLQYAGGLLKPISLTAVLHYLALDHRPAIGPDLAQLLATEAMNGPEIPQRQKHKAE